MEVEVYDLEVSDPRRLKVLEDENRNLKKLLADEMLGNAMLRDLNPKNGEIRREAASCGAALPSL